jgi:hypothetical protein
MQKGDMDMAQELDSKIRNLRDELTRLVRDGLDEDGLILRRMLAELERLENQRSTLRSQAARM